MAQINKLGIQAEKPALRESKHLMLEMNYIMPDNKPRINSIVEAAVMPTVSASSLSGSSLEFTISADCNIIYNALSVSEDEEHLYSTATSFTKSFKEIHDFESNDDSLRQSNAYTVDIKCNNVEAVLISDRKVIIKAYVTVDAMLKTVNETEAVSSFDDNAIITKYGSCETLRSVGIMRVQSFIKEDVKLPENYPSVDVIIKKCASVNLESKRISDSKAIFYGVLHGDIIYSNMGSSPKFYPFSFDVNFNQAAEIPDVSENAILDIRSCITELSIDAKENNILGVEALVSFEVEVFDFFSVKIVKDAFLPGMELELKKEEICGMNTFLLTNNVGICSEKISVPEGDIESVLFSSVIASECHAYIENKNIYFDGIYKVTSLYVPKSDPNTLKSITKDVPYNYMFEAGALKGDVLFSAVTAKSITSQLNDFGEITVKWVSSADAVIKEEFCCDIITAASASPLSKPEENAIYYHFVMPGENAWDIAKQFKVKPSELCKMNNVECESDIAGMRGVVVVKSKV